MLATIYVAIVVPFNASFPDTFNCNNVSFVDTLTSDQVVATFEYSNETSTFQETLVVDDDQKKRFVVLDVIVETIFILGELELSKT